ncbi:aspartate--tRNA ligase, cytoplasmic isoform X2 [Acyrthosiphon pisum]|uniref:Aspartate--tRNA ligase, cytoplasmic n=1 Tax=Acyrthosiphon pisum TaxID=7029 RepID=A0A8R2ABE0_ACYPI|nr:aspartate--tRNA ligase, cytoplasmic isoform X2 [Acyrthosiphon pisum]|eukprot:XP_003245957.1 PREDICTED: aspartate--tRNA ligase, cytoplasmic isoform X1 [Acyrthosiphon pisum]
MNGNSSQNNESSVSTLSNYTHPSETSIDKANTNDQESGKDISVGKYGVLKMIQSSKNVLYNTEFVRVKNIKTNLADKSVWIRGRLHTSYARGKQCFMIVRQQQWSIQVLAVVSDTISKQFVKFCSNITKESVVDIKGKVARTPSKIGSCSQKDVELYIEELWVVSQSADQLPLLLEDAYRPVNGDDKDADIRANLDTKLDNRAIDLRTPANQAIFRLEAVVCKFFREILTAKGFVEIFPPRIKNAVTGNGTNVFKISYFKGSAYLAQCPTFHNIIAIAGDFERVFTIGPVFRPEDSNSHRHLTEFTNLNLEMTFKHHYHEVVDVIASLFTSIFKGLRENYQSEIKTICEQYSVEPFKFLDPPLKLEFPMAVNMLRENGVEMGDEDDLSIPNEKLLGRLVKAKYDTDFYILDKFPLAIRSFETMPDPDSKVGSNSYDMFMRGEEVLTGGQRIHDYHYLMKRAKHCQVDIEKFAYYLDAFRYGCPPLAGGGIGLERVVMLYLGLDNIRIASMFPRDSKRLTP